jgi:hypothetical protein
VRPEALCLYLRLLAHPFTGPDGLTGGDRAALIEAAQYIEDTAKALNNPAVRLVHYTLPGILGIDEVRRIEAEGGDDGSAG